MELPTISLQTCKHLNPNFSFTTDETTSRDLARRSCRGQKKKVSSVRVAEMFRKTNMQTMSEFSVEGRH